MNNTDAINVLENEVLCVSRQMEEGCDRDCGKCDLSLAGGEIIPAYEMAIAALSAQQEPISPCAACGYGGKYLDAPPCTECPAHPKIAEKDEPIVRCKDCKFYERVEYWPNGHKDVCHILKVQMLPGAFCSLGERRNPPKEDDNEQA